MSTAVPLTPTTATAPIAVGYVPDKEIRVFGHNNLFYWWPVWVLGFVMAALTYVDGHVMAVLPRGTQVESGQVLPGTDGQPRDVLVAPPGKPIAAAPPAEKAEPPLALLVAANNNYGVVFIAAMLFVIVVSNITLRGLASVVALGAILIVILFIALMGWWDDVLAWLGGLDVRMNASGYLVFAVPLCLIWLFSTFVYDHYVYLIVTRGQVRIRQAIGEGELAVDSAGLVLDKKRNDLFRHWILGLGSGDLHVKTGGPANLDFDLYNVLFVGTKLAGIQDLLREKEVAEQAPGR